MCRQSRQQGKKGLREEGGREGELQCEATRRLKERVEESRFNLLFDTRGDGEREETFQR